MSKVNLKQQAYNIIKEKIITCEYAPNMDLSEAYLLEDTGLSRQPIRDALSRLEQEHLITIKAKKGVRVSDVTINDINMIFEARNLIEPYIIRRYGERIDKHELQNIRKQFVKMLSLEQSQKLSEAYTAIELRVRQEADDNFHQQVIQGSGNTYLVLFMQLNNNQNTRLRALTSSYSKNSDSHVDFTSFTHNRMCNSHQEHIKIIDFLLKNQYEDAALAMEEHLASSKDAIFKTIICNGGWAMLEALN